MQFPTEDGSWAWSEPVEVSSGCTGWFASEEGHIVTAGHCLDPAEVEGDIRHEFLVRNDATDLEDEAQSWQVAGYEGGAPDRTDVWVVQPSAVEGTVIDDPLTVQVLDYQPLQDGDLALLKANGLQEPTPPLAVATDAPEIGDALTAIGYPGSVMRVSDVSRLRASFKSGTVSSVQVNAKGVSDTEINAQVSAGMSGGPTIDGNGAVLGVNSFGIVGEEQSFNFITDGAALRSFLERQGVEPRVGGGDTQTVPVGDRRRLDPSSAGSAADSSAAGLGVRCRWRAGARARRRGRLRRRHAPRRSADDAGARRRRPAPAPPRPLPRPLPRPRGHPGSPRLRRRGGRSGPG